MIPHMPAAGSLETGGSRRFALQPNDHKEAWSFAYIGAVAAAAGYECGVACQFDRDSVDLSIQGKGTSGTLLAMPKLDLQAKCTTHPDVSGDVLRFRLSRKNYDDLRSHAFVPRLLVVVVAPSDARDWLQEYDDHMQLRQQAFWYSLAHEEPRPPSVTVAVEIPLAQRLTPDALEMLMCKVADGDRP